MKDRYECSYQANMIGLQYRSGLIGGYEGMQVMYDCMQAKGYRQVFVNAK